MLASILSILVEAYVGRQDLIGLVCVIMRRCPNSNGVLVSVLWL